MGTIVVGVDGSPGGDAALRWALAEARLRGARLRVVHAYELPQAPLADAGIGVAGVTVPSIPADDLERLRSLSEEQARSVIDSALQRADGNASVGLEIDLAPLAGRPAETLIEAGRGAELLVLGSRGRGGFLGLLLGSV